MIRQVNRYLCLLALVGILFAVPAFAQSLVAAPAPWTPDFARLIVHDEARIFGAPVHVRKKDWSWLLPAAGATAFLFATDNRNMQERIHINPVAAGHAGTVSNLGVAALGLAPALLAWHGWRNRESYEEETGWLAARAVADTLITGEVVRLVTRRERVDTTGGGNFFQSGVTSGSFPSFHAASAWAVASVLAHRYPGWLTKIAAYGLAGGVSVSRVLARQHSPSDVEVGSLLGLLIGQSVTGTRRLPSKRWLLTDTPASAPTPSHESQSADSGSAYIPMDSWIYPALDRLGSLGLIPSQTSSLRPWTRAECLRQVSEADHAVTQFKEAQELVDAIREELDRMGGRLVLESLYVRNGVIAGPVLNDSFHFGQTWANDSGRPFGRGWNSNAGFKLHAESGRFFAYWNGEVQHAPGAAPDSLAVRQAISSLDGVPVQAAGSGAAINRFQSLDAYAGVRLGDFEFSAGQQTMWWGPTADSPLSFGTNALPTKNFRASTVHPIRLPEFLGHVVSIRGEFVIGKLGGQKYTWRPWFNAQKITFKLTENLEMGFTRWSIFWGVGHPITLNSFIRNFVSTSSPIGPTGVGASDPGDRKGGFDFRYRVPGLRNWLTLYSDSYCDDDPSPLAAPRRAAINPGIYLTHVPGIPRLDFRVEAPSTSPMSENLGGSFIYTNSQYLSGNTNYGYLLGNSVGRDARALEGTTTYWFSARNQIELSFRHLKGSSDFLPGGATQSDATLQFSAGLGKQWHADLGLQYERFWVPLLGGPQRNLSARLQLTFEPAQPLVK